LTEIAGAASTSGKLGDLVGDACSQVGNATDWMLSCTDINDRFAGAVPYLRAWALLLGASYLSKAATKDPARVPLAEFHVRQILPQIGGLLAAATAGAAPLYALDANSLAG
jgi:hypothetical protein